MYESFYRFREKPFSLLPDPGFLYLGKEHSTALAMLRYGLMNQAGFTVVTGEIGSGKTTLVRQLLKEANRATTIGLIVNTGGSVDDTLHSVLAAFNIVHQPRGKVEAYRALTQFFVGELQRRRRAVLIVDEAQNMSVQVLEELRMLSNVNADKHHLVQLILVGQPQLRDLLQRRDMEQLAQRVVVDYHLRPLNREETGQYIRHRLTVAGGNPGIFEEAAYDVVFEYTGGTPRLINVLCDTALACGYGEQAARIGAGLMRTVAEDKVQSGILPLRERAEPTASRQAAGAEAPAPVGSGEEPVLPEPRQMPPMTEDDLRMLFQKTR